MSQAFVDQVQSGYKFNSAFLTIGCGMLQGKVVPDTFVHLPLPKRSALFINGYKG